jgi:hypothetical protein
MDARHQRSFCFYSYNTMIIFLKIQIDTWREGKTMLELRRYSDFSLFKRDVLTFLEQHEGVK